jgi:hypothetical protein
VEKQPTTTHAETGTAHADAEVATKVDGTTAVPEAEVKEEVAETAPAAEGSKAAVADEPKEKKDKVAVKVCFLFFFSHNLSLLFPSSRSLLFIPPTSLLIPIEAS